MKISNDIIGNRNHNFLVCSAMPEPTACLKLNSATCVYWQVAVSPEDAQVLDQWNVCMCVCVCVCMCVCVCVFYEYKHYFLWWGYLITKTYLHYNYRSFIQLVVLINVRAVGRHLRIPIHNKPTVASLYIYIYTESDMLH
jgi:hypothetical protein